MLVSAGVIRIIVKGERIAGGMNSLDRLMILWAVWALFSSVFHKNPSGALIFRLGLVLNTCGVYFLLRIFCQSLEDVVGLYPITLILLVPVAVEMLYEKFTQNNLFYALGGLDKHLAIREGKIRAQGPFAHSILAGTVGAVCLPFAIAMWRENRKVALIGIGACLIMIFAATSSGPILSAAAAIGAVIMWHYRQRMRLIRWLAALGYICLNLIMDAPAYFLMARIDLTGGSQGWHRARLIQSSFQHLNEWWIGGTDYTRHWMPTGIAWSADHTDITNHYIKMGVIGGLPLMLLFIIILITGFSFLGKTLRNMTDTSQKMHFTVWTLGASLFGHAATFLSVSYYDQSFVFLYLTLALIGSTWSAIKGDQGSMVMLQEEMS